MPAFIKDYGTLVATTSVVVSEPLVLGFMAYFDREVTIGLIVYVTNFGSAFAGLTMIVFFISFHMNPPKNKLSLVGRD